MEKKCVLFFSTTLFETFLILRRIERDMIKMCIGLQAKTCYTCPITKKFNFFSFDIRKTIKYKIE